MREYSDPEIIECLRKRESYVVHYLFDRYLPMIRLMVYQMGGTGEDAKDIFQDALLIMIQKIDSEEFVLTCKFKTFLYSVCENLWKSILTRRSASANYLVRKMEENDNADFTELYDNQLYEHLFYDMFESLDPRCKKILTLYWQEFSPKEIADRLGYTYGYVRKKKCECQSELIGKVKDHREYKAIIKTQEASNTIVL